MSRVREEPRCEAAPESDVPLRPCDSGSGTGAAGHVRGTCVLWGRVTIPKRTALQPPRALTPPVGRTAEAMQTPRAMELLSEKQIAATE